MGCEKNVALKNRRQSHSWDQSACGRQRLMHETFVNDKGGNWSIQAWLDLHTFRTFCMQFARSKIHKVAQG